MKKLSKEKETYGDELDAVVNVCTDVSSFSRRSFLVFIFFIFFVSLFSVI